MAISTLSTSIHVSLIILYAIVLAEASLVIVSEKTTFEVGDTIVINCTTVSHSAQSVQWFFNSNPIPENQYTVISADLSQLVIPQSNFSNAGNYSCALLEVYALFQRVASVQIEVGEKPHPISSFNCFVADESMFLCRWDDGGPTNIPTRRTLMHKKPYAYSNWEACRDTGTSVNCPDLHSYTYYCLMGYGYNAYEIIDLLNFTVITENALGTAATLIPFTCCDALLFSPSNTEAVAMSGECVAVSWDYPCEWEHIISVVLTSFPLQYRLRYKSEWDADKWEYRPFIGDVKRKRFCHLEGYTNYSIQLSVSPFHSGQWSHFSDIVVVRTLEQAPVSPLEISNENMDSQDDSSKRDVTVYWKGAVYLAVASCHSSAIMNFRRVRGLLYPATGFKALKPLGLRKMKGEVLGYTITMNKEGENIKISVNASANATSQVLQGLEKYASYNIQVVTFNSAGSSPPSSLTILDLALVIVSEKKTFEVGDTIVINCTTVPHSAQSVQWFFNSNHIPENQSTVISADLSQLVIPQSNFSNAGNYSCALLDALLEKTATVQIEVGEKPHPVSSFNCFSFFEGTLLCTWDDGGPTNIPTTRTLLYKGPYAHSKLESCLDIGIYVNCPDLHSYSRHCLTGYSDNDTYGLNFTVITENALGTAATLIPFTCCDAVLFAPRNTKAVAMSGECVAVSWDYPCEGEVFWSTVFFSVSLQYRLRYKSEWDADELDNSTYQEGVKTMRVCKLEGYTHYSIQVSARLLDWSNMFFSASGFHTVQWSHFSDIVVVRTLEQAPVSHLEICYENMDSQDESSKRDVTVYWKPLGLRKMKGEVLGYTITMNKEGENIKISVNASANATSQVLQGLEKYASYNIQVVTFNSAGSSPPSSLTILAILGAANITSISKTSRSISLRWQLPYTLYHHSNGNQIRMSDDDIWYNITYCISSEPSSCVDVNIGSAKVVTLSDKILPSTTYDITLQGNSRHLGHGDIAKMTVTTDEEDNKRTAIIVTSTVVALMILCFCTLFYCRKHQVWIYEHCFKSIRKEDFSEHMDQVLNDRPSVPSYDESFLYDTLNNTSISTSTYHVSASVSAAGVTESSQNVPLLSLGDILISPPTLDDNSSTTAIELMEGNFRGRSSENLRSSDDSPNGVNTYATHRFLSASRNDVVVDTQQVSTTYV